jgi:mevalonate kinase
MLLAHTGVSRHSGKVHKSVRLRWEEGEPLVVKSMERIAELARVGKGALLSKDWQTVGELMNENHAIVRELGGSGESNERLIKAALEGGAIGAKLAGAGGGGTIIVLTLDPQTTKDALQKAGAEQFLALSPSSSGVTVKWI